MEPARRTDRSGDPAVRPLPGAPPAARGRGRGGGRRPGRGRARGRSDEETGAADRPEPHRRTRGRLTDELEAAARRAVIPDDPTILSYLLSGIIQVDQPRRQELLEAETTEARLRELLRLIDREVVLLERRLRNFTVDPRTSPRSAGTDGGGARGPPRRARGLGRDDRPLDRGQRPAVARLGGVPADFGWRPEYLVADDGSRVLALARPWPLIGGDGVYVSRGPLPETIRVVVLARLEAVTRWVAARGATVISSEARSPRSQATGRCWPRPASRRSRRSSRPAIASRSTSGLADAGGPARPRFSATTRNMIRAAERSDLADRRGRGPTRPTSRFRRPAGRGRPPRRTCRRLPTLYGLMR